MGQRDQLVVEIDQGEDFAAQLYWCDDAGDPYTLTYPCQMDVRDAAGTLAMRFYAIATNGITNPTFESDTNNTAPASWTAGSNTAIVASTTTSYSGTKSMRLSATTGSVAQAYNTENTNTVSAGLSYTASAYVKGGANARPAQITIDWYTSTGSVAGTSSAGTAQNTTTTGWTLITATGKAPDGASYAKVTIQFSSLANSTDYQYADNIKFEIGAVCTNIPTTKISLLKISSTAKGYMQLYSPAAVTKDLTAGTYVFDLYATTSTSSGYFTGNLQTSKICSGYVMVNSRVTDMG